MIDDKANFFVKIPSGNLQISELALTDDSNISQLRFSTELLVQFTQSMNFPIGRFMRFGLVGLSEVFVDMAVLYLLSDPTTLGLPLTRSKIIAAEIAIINNFLWNDA
jgi:dolichol-phosphate mannosyltransferase